MGKVKENNKFSTSSNKNHNSSMRRKVQPIAKVKKKIQEKRDARAKQAAERIAQQAELRQKLFQEKSERDRLHKKKRLERTKVVSKKTNRGQPLMKNRMEYLLKQILEMKRT